MKKILLALAFLVGSIASASAACTSPATMHDFPGASFLMSLSTNGDGNCQSNVAVPSWAGGVLGAMANFGTSPGAVLVPGVNAASFQQGVWTMQPGNTANTTAWLMNMGSMGGTAISSSCVSNYGTAPGAVACPSSNVFVTNTLTGLGNNADAIASTAAPNAGSPVVNYNYGYNGTTWDRLQVDGSKNLKITGPVTATGVAGAINVTPTNCSGSIGTGGTAQNVFAAQTTLHGFTIVNFSTDGLWISFTATAAANTIQSFPLNPGTATTSGGTFTSPLGFGVNTAVSIVGATLGDKYSCVWW